MSQGADPVPTPDQPEALASTSRRGSGQGGDFPLPLGYAAPVHGGQANTESQGQTVARARRDVHLLE